MKKLVLVAAALAAIAPSIAAAAPAPRANIHKVQYAPTYSCWARSNHYMGTSWGVWTAYDVPSAKQGALYQCAIRTPQGYVCVVTHCQQNP